MSTEVVEGGGVLCGSLRQTACFVRIPDSASDSLAPAADSARTCDLDQYRAIVTRNKKVTLTFSGSRITKASLRSFELYHPGIHQMVNEFHN
jgi:hypothetical protein